MIVKEADNLCVCCGNIIPEGMQVCPICANSDKGPEFKIDDVIEQAFRQGYDSGYDTAIKWYEDYIVKTENEYCELKQENETLKRENAMLKSQIEAYNSDSDEETE